jgi:signal transduction histidine kinase
MVHCRSVLADMLRERRRLIEQLHNVQDQREEVLHRLRDVERRIRQEEERGSRAYLDHIFGRAPTSDQPQEQP